MLPFFTLLLLFFRAKGIGHHFGLGKMNGLSTANGYGMTTETRNDIVAKVSHIQ
jgi:hypothetical protein